MVAVAEERESTLRPSSGTPPRWQMKEHVFERGDALVFVSHKYHCVAPVTHGERRVLVIELWEGEERSCPHRCTERTGVCMLAQRTC